MSQEPVPSYVQEEDGDDEEDEESDGREENHDQKVGPVRRILLKFHVVLDARRGKLAISLESHRSFAHH